MDLAVPRLEHDQALCGHHFEHPTVPTGVRSLAVKDAPLKRGNGQQYAAGPNSVDGTQVAPVSILWQVSGGGENVNWLLLLYSETCWQISWLRETTLRVSNPTGA
jgi:hypothetical protein